MKRQADIHRNRKSIAFYCFLTLLIGLAMFSACDVSVPFDWNACWIPKAPIAGNFKVTGSCPNESGSQEYTIGINEFDCETYTITNFFNTSSYGKVRLHYDYDYDYTNDSLFNFSISEQYYQKWNIQGHGTLRVKNNLKTLTLEMTLNTEGQTQTCTITGRKA